MAVLSHHPGRYEARPGDLTGCLIADARSLSGNHKDAIIYSSVHDRAIHVIQGEVYGYSNYKLETEPGLISIVHWPDFNHPFYDDFLWAFGLIAASTR